MNESCFPAKSRDKSTSHSQGNERMPEKRKSVKCFIAQQHELKNSVAKNTK